MNPIARKLLIFALLTVSLMPVGLLIPHYSTIYATLQPYRIEGIGVCWLGAYVLANLCTPAFMQASNQTEYENSGPRAISTLYWSVMLITFGALAVVTVVLWCIGWLLVLIQLPFYWLKELVKDLLLG